MGSPEPTQQASCNSSTKDVNERRDLLNAELKEYKGEKLKRKLPVDNQLLNVSQEELKVIPLKLFYYQTFLETWKINIHYMNIKKMQ